MKRTDSLLCLACRLEKPGVEHQIPGQPDRPQFPVLRVCLDCLGMALKEIGGVVTQPAYDRVLADMREQADERNRAVGERAEAWARIAELEPQLQITLDRLETLNGENSALKGVVAEQAKDIHAWTRGKTPPSVLKAEQAAKLEELAAAAA